MGARVRIQAGDAVVEAELNDSATSRAVLEALPFEGEGNRWGEEVYFEVPLDLPPEDPTTDVEVGEVGYWPPGRAVAIFFGPTPLSDGEKPVPASGVNRMGQVRGDPKALRLYQTGQPVKMEKIGT